MTYFFSVLKIMVVFVVKIDTFFFIDHYFSLSHFFVTLSILLLLCITYYIDYCIFLCYLFAKATIGFICNKAPLGFFSVCNLYGSC